MNPLPLILTVALCGAVTALPQDPPKREVTEATPLSPDEAAARLNGAWKLNEELSPPLRAGLAPVTGGNARGSLRGGGPGAGGRPQAYEYRRLQQERDIRTRALYRELSIAPETLTLTVSAGAAAFADPDAGERRVTIDGRKEKVDLGTAVLDSRARWDGNALTIELDGGEDLKLVETFEPSPTGNQMLVTIRAGDEHAANTRGLRGQVQRVYDRVKTGGGRVVDR